MAKKRTSETNIPLSRTTRDELRACKIGNETYDDLIRRLLEEAGAVKNASGDKGAAIMDG